jgi:hypothetical protein
MSEEIQSEESTVIVEEKKSKVGRPSKESTSQTDKPTIEFVASCIRELDKVIVHSLIKNQSEIMRSLSKEKYPEESVNSLKEAIAKLQSLVDVVEKFKP